MMRVVVRDVAVAIFLVIALALGACSKGLVVRSDFDEDADFAQLKSWDWIPGGAAESEDRRLNDPKVRERIERVIEGAFVGRGYSRDPASPDFHVNYYVILGEEISERRIGNFAEYENYTVFVPGWTSTYTDVYETGTVIVDVLDIREQRLVWRGSVQAEINPQAGPRENEPKIKKALTKLLERFPPE